VNDAPFEPRALQISKACSETKFAGRDHYKLESRAVMRAIASQESPLGKGFFKKLFIRIKPA